MGNLNFQSIYPDQLPFSIFCQVSSNGLYPFCTASTPWSDISVSRGGSTSSLATCTVVSSVVRAAAHAAC
eukprot:1942184-Amphidinium_carterae.1